MSSARVSLLETVQWTPRIREICKILEGRGWDVIHTQQHPGTGAYQTRIQTRMPNGRRAVAGFAIDSQEFLHSLDPHTILHLYELRLVDCVANMEEFLSAADTAALHPFGDDEQ